MLVSHRKQFIYTKTHKTAGTSVEVYFEKYCMPEGYWHPQQERSEYVSPTGIIGRRSSNTTGATWYNHMPAAAIREQVGQDTWERYFKFCVIRDPFDKLVSGFFFSHRDSDWRVHDPVPVFREWVQAERFVIDRDKYTIDDKLCLDDYVRFEALGHELARICDLLGVPYDPAQVPRLKGGFRNTALPLSAFYDADTVDVVRESFAFELESFGYAPPHQT